MASALSGNTMKEEDGSERKKNSSFPNSCWSGMFITVERQMYIYT